MNKKKKLFTLRDGTPVFAGDILFHDDLDRVGDYCIAEFSPRDEQNKGMVTVRSPNGAVPTVLISELSVHRKLPKRCNRCGQLLPPD